MGEHLVKGKKSKEVITIKIRVRIVLGRRGGAFKGLEMLVMSYFFT
jgi:hypothetical protein